MNRSGRKGIVELLRFIFALLVVLVHAHGLRVDDPANYPFAGGYIAVEFFLILSGYFATREAIRGGAEDLPGMFAVKYTFRQYWKILPIVFVSVVLCYAAVYIMGGVDTQDLPYIVYEVLCLPQSGIYKVFLNPPLWYLSAYVICLPLFIYLLRKSKDFFYHVGTMMAPLLIYGFICRKNVDIDIWSFDSGIWYIGLLRVFAGLCMGTCCYRISVFLEKQKVAFLHKKALPVLGIIALTCVIGYTAEFAFTYADYFLIFIMAVSLALILEGEYKCGDHCKAFIFMGRLSVSLYCSHWTIRYIVPRMFPDKGYWELLPIYLVSSLIYALAVMYLSTLLTKLMLQIKERVYYDSKI